MVGIACLTAEVQPLGPVTGAKYQKTQTKEQGMPISRILKGPEGEGYQKTLLAQQSVYHLYKPMIHHPLKSLYLNSFL